MSSYRIKTEAEFIEAFGEGWREDVEHHWASPNMDHLFNLPLSSVHLDSEPERIFAVVPRSDRPGSWNVSKDMVIYSSEESTPYYEPMFARTTIKRIRRDQKKSIRLKQEF